LYSCVVIRSSTEETRHFMNRRPHSVTRYRTATNDRERRQCPVWRGDPSRSSKTNTTPLPQRYVDGTLDMARHASSSRQLIPQDAVILACLRLQCSAINLADRRLSKLRMLQFDTRSRWIPLITMARHADIPIDHLRCRTVRSSSFFRYGESSPLGPEGASAKFYAVILGPCDDCDFGTSRYP
jgi:hypothetical protein